VRLRATGNTVTVMTRFSFGTPYVFDKPLLIALSTSFDVAFCGIISVISTLSTSDPFDNDMHSSAVFLTNPSGHNGIHLVNSTFHVIPGKHAQLALPRPAVEFTTQGRQAVMPAIGAYVSISQNLHGLLEKYVLYLPRWHTTHMSEETSGHMHASAKISSMIVYITTFI
jgi:hypothetical protein